ncbi:hypothetical protein RLOC_00011431 [Lonchura striata]|uniref:Uncharacterized protein n=1 Tax=Lonchura striata TaxID=40157 RepID=A0A218UV08_9PASE|nr:hypothetical protein RLOC_00011431 [Lonchura striata domestica]
MHYNGKSKTFCFMGQRRNSCKGDCSHCHPRFWKFKDTQCSERRCRTVSLCSQEQFGHSLFKTCNCGSGR